MLIAEGRFHGRGYRHWAWPGALSAWHEASASMVIAISNHRNAMGHRLSEWPFLYEHTQLWDEAHLRRPSGTAPSQGRPPRRRRVATT